MQECVVGLGGWKRSKCSQSMERWWKTLHYGALFSRTIRINQKLYSFDASPSNRAKLMMQELTLQSQIWWKWYSVQKEKSGIPFIASPNPYRSIGEVEIKKRLNGTCHGVIKCFMRLCTRQENVKFHRFKRIGNGIVGRNGQHSSDFDDQVSTISLMFPGMQCCIYCVDERGATNSGGWQITKKGCGTQCQSLGMIQVHP